MTTVTHAKVSAIPDDSASSVAGKVLPSDWNADHVVSGGIEVVSVKDFGAVGDGIANDTVAIQAALDSGAGAPITIYFPTGTYKVYPSIAGAPPSPYVQPYPVGYQSLRINYSNITLLGDGPSQSIISSWVAGGLSPEGNFFDMLPGINSTTWRGPAFYVPDDYDNIVFRGLRITGNALRSTLWTLLDQVPYAQYNVFDGDGWDNSHHAVWWRDGSVHTNVQFIGCELDSWKGEIVVGGGCNFTPLIFDSCILHDSNGDGISLQANIQCRFTEFYAINQATECGFYSTNGTWENNYIHDCGNGYIHVNQADSPFTGGETVYRNNYIVNCRRAAISIANFARNVSFTNNIVVCGATGSPSIGGSPTILLQLENVTGAGLAANVNVDDNLFVIADYTIPAIIQLTDAGGAAPVEGIYIRRNITMLTDDAATNSLSIGSVLWIFGTFAGAAVVQDNDFSQVGIGGGGFFDNGGDGIIEMRGNTWPAINYNDVTTIAPPGEGYWKCGSGNVVAGLPSPSLTAGKRATVTDALSVELGDPVLTGGGPYVVDLSSDGVAAWYIAAARHGQLTTIIPFTAASASAAPVATVLDVPIGSTIVLLIFTNSNETSAVVIDSAGNSYTVVEAQDGFRREVAIAYSTAIANALPAGGTITVTTAPFAGSSNIIAFAFPGGGPALGSGTALASANTISVATGALSGAPAIIFGAHNLLATAATTPEPPTGWTEVPGLSNPISGYKYVDTTTSVTYTQTFAGVDDIGAVIVALGI